MGSALFRNRFWYYRSLYDDYCGREFRLAYGMAAIIWLPHYYWGVHLNREIETHFSHRAYALEYLPRRNRLTHSLIFEEFETIIENWQNLNDEYKSKGKAMLEE
mmetsp:Transcript_114877/g.171749  ORF Transcript_114877/g.171749 Transcript_114877/m.171749 type:complete len:104 (-) Transcript_114877:36-347(-)